MAASETAARAYHHGALREALLQRAAEVIEASGIEALTLRGLARDLGVSHGAPNRHFRSKDDLLAALATLGYKQMHAATLGAAELVGDDPWVRLNAMGRGYLKWALSNPALFKVILHPDVSRFASEDLRLEMQDTMAAIRSACDAAQADGRHAGVDPSLLALYTNAVPYGAAALLSHPVFAGDVVVDDIDQLVADIVELVVPIRNR